MLFVRIFLILVLLSMANAFFFKPYVKSGCSKNCNRPVPIRKPHRRIKINSVKKRRSTTTTSTRTASTTSRSTASTTTPTTTSTSTTSTSTPTTTPTTTTTTTTSTTPATVIVG